MKYFGDFTFRYPFRKYQRMVLEQIITAQTDRKYHIVAPPGSGKTILGLELIRRLDEPAVVFAPTTTIQAQWYDKVGLFLKDPQNVPRFASMDPHERAPIHIFTYHLISTPAEAQEHLREAALRLWQEELVQHGQAASMEQAEQRQELLRQNNPSAYRKEVLRYSNRIKHRLLREPETEIAPFLHPNARKLIDELSAYGVKTVVLDECHHLLDYWAIVLRYLIQRLQDPYVIGLTATLPSPDGDEEFENYDSLLGEVDFEVPTPAVVKEGDLAPYRDLVYLVKPTPREREYLNKIQTEFERALAALTDNPRFREWVRSIGTLAANLPNLQDEWQKRWNDRPLLMLAAIRFLNSIGEPPAPQLPTPREALDPLELEDWSVLLERFGLDVLKPSSDTEDHHLLQRLRKAILPFGLTLTERGMQQSRSPGDLVLTFSESKDFAVTHILRAESKAMGDKLRAMVVTDFERISSGVKQLNGILDNDSGSAVRLFAKLATNPDTIPLCPTLVTGNLFLLPAQAAPAILEEFQSALQHQNLRASCTLKPTRDPRIVELTGEGPDWSSRAYVHLATQAFEKGAIKCLVGTRGIFGEGWDSLSLNTLIDLTSVTTSTAVQQLRGRTIRLDPNWKRKVAHNWDVVCIAPGYQRGALDFERFIKRHSRYWSLVIYTDWLGERSSASRSTPPALHGTIAKGAIHVSPELTSMILSGQKGLLQDLNIHLHNTRTIQQIPKREQVYDLWDVGGEYSNFSYNTTTLNTRDLKIKTVFTLEITLKKLIRYLFTSIATLATFLLYYSSRYWLSSLLSGLEYFLLCSLAFFGIISLSIWIFYGKEIIHTVRSLFAVQIPDAILLDIGRALLESLRQLGLVSRNLTPDFVRVIQNGDDTYSILLDYASPEDSDTFIRAFQEIFEPVRDQRYLIMRTEDRMPNLPLQMLWLPIRQWVRQTGMYPPAYHPVPKILATRKEYVQMFAKYWQRYVGGGEIVFTRSETGRAILLAARAQRRPNVKQQAFEIWK
ncbi:MAG: hypothetical protein DDG60_02495 [Anaerolineae bacterium]|nr:MAG: hypothetical protein DDG60_02495 [Anaerolineae bacterium]